MLSSPQQLDSLGVLRSSAIKAGGKLGGSLRLLKKALVKTDWPGSGVQADKNINAALNKGGVAPQLPPSLQAPTCHYNLW